MRKILIIILGIMLVISGVGLLMYPVSAFGILGNVMGLALLVNGVANIIIWFKEKEYYNISIWYLISAILSVIFAIMIFGDVFMKLAVETMCLYLIAGWFIITGIIRIVFAFKIKNSGLDKIKNSLFSKWWVLLIIGVLLIICGILSFMNPLILVLTIGINLGINMIICGIDLITIGTLI